MSRVSVLTWEVADQLLAEQGVDIIIPDGYTSIVDEAFAGYGLKSVVIPESIETIGKYAFQHNKLTNIEIGDGVISIGFEAFHGNELTSVAIPNSVTSIAPWAFAYNKIESVDIGDSVQSIESSVFENNKLQSVEIPGNVKIIGERAFNNNELISVHFSEGVTRIQGQAFALNKLKNVVIPDSVKGIGVSAFAYNEIESVDIGDGVVRIAETAFHDNKLKSVEFGDSVETIGERAFEENQLTSVHIPDSAKTIKVSAFDKNALEFASISEDAPFSGWNFLWGTLIDYRGLDQAPTDIFLSSSTLDENLAGGSVVATLSTADLDEGETHTYQLVSGIGDTDNDSFSIEGDQLKIRSSPDLVKKSNYSVRLKATDSSDFGLVFEKVFTLGVNGLAEVPIIQSIDDVSMQKKVTTFKFLEAINSFGQDIDHVIIGTKKKDKIIGTSEGEVLAGMKGKDLLKGGKGADGFLFNQTASFGGKYRDLIQDFNSEEGDSILVDQDFFDTGKKIKLKPCKNKWKFRKAKKSINDFVYDERTGLLYFNENGKQEGWGDGGLFAKLLGTPALGAEDFTIV